LIKIRFSQHLLKYQKVLTVADGMFIYGKKIIRVDPIKWKEPRSTKKW